MKDNFVHLHTHSTYSFTDGYGLPEQYIKRCEELNQPAMAISVHTTNGIKVARKQELSQFLDVKCI